MQRAAERFDRQADVFDERAGIPASVARDVALAVLEVASPPPGAAIGEIGAGTGEIGRHLASLRGRYLGLDLSRPMLHAFQAKLRSNNADRNAQLVQADADRTWPVRDRSLAAVFASRVAHLLAPGHLVDQLTRVCRPRAVFLVGRVERDQTGVKSMLRRQRERMLRERGIVPQGGRERTGTLMDHFETRGWARLEARTVAAWTTSVSAEQVLAAWAQVPTMGAVHLPADARAAILQQLREWARHELGDLSRPRESTEQYRLAGVGLS